MHESPSYDDFLSDMLWNRSKRDEHNHLSHKISYNIIPPQPPLAGVYCLRSTTTCRSHLSLSLGHREGASYTYLAPTPHRCDLYDLK